jgi:hypothetical protein
MDMYGRNGVPPSPALIEAIRTRRYNAPRLRLSARARESMGPTPSGGEDWSKMQAVFEQILRTLPALGYEPVVVPKTDVATRAAWVMDVVSLGRIDSPLSCD